MCGIGALLRVQCAEPAEVLRAKWRQQLSDAASAVHAEDQEAGASAQVVSNAACATSQEIAIVEDSVAASLRRRGPDHFGKRLFSVTNTSGMPQISLLGSVLHLRGSKLATQPVELSDSSCFVYNGEVFGLLLDEADELANHSIHGDSWLATNEVSDTDWLREQLDKLMAGGDENSATDCMMVALFERIQGPFAFLHYCPKRQRLFCMRDTLGRRSLCLSISTLGPGSSTCTVCVTNVAAGGESAIELPCTGAVILQLSTHGADTSIAVQLVPRRRSVLFCACHDDSGADRERVSACAASTGLCAPTSVMVQYQTRFNAALRDAVRRRVAHHERVSVLFSGGLDSSVLAALAAEEIMRSGCRTLQQEDGQCRGLVQLINVSFDSAGAPDRHTCLLSFSDLRRRFPRGTFDLILVDLSLDMVEKERILDLLGPNNTHMDFNIATCLWYASRGQGYVLADDLPERTALIDELVGQAFVPSCKRPGDEDRSAQRRRKVAESFPELEIDSITGPWQTEATTDALVAVRPDLSTPMPSEPLSQQTPYADVSSRAAGAEQGPPELTGTNQKKKVKRSKQPSHQKAHRSVNASRIDPGLYNGSRTDAAIFQIGTAPSAVLLLGHGADELLGGYARHISAFDKRGLAGLEEELLLDLNRLWTRNLGRDDRVVSDHGKEARHPFLDEDFIRTVRSLPALVDKLFLREFARSELGLVNAAGFEKRAIQFGTRIAKHSNVEKFGSNRQAEGTAKYAA